MKGTHRKEEWRGGKILAGPVEAVGRRGAFALSLIAEWLSGPRYRGRVTRETFRTVRRCVAPVCAVAGPLGMVVALQGAEIVAAFGAQRSLPALLVLVILREVAPLATGLMLALQAGNAYASELGAMRVQDEWDALVLMGVSPAAYHVLPRVAAIALAAPPVFLCGGSAGILAGRFSILARGEISQGAFDAEMLSFLRWEDIWGGMLKTFCFGLLTGIVCCFEGFHSGGGERGAARAGTRGVTASVVILIAANFFLSSILYGAAGP